MSRLGAPPWMLAGVAFNTLIVVFCLLRLILI